MIHLIVAATMLTLDDVERAALTHAPAVAQARAVVTEKAALLEAARGGAIPHAFVGYTRLPQGEPTGNLVQHLTTVGGQVTLNDIANATPAQAQSAADLRSAQSAEVTAERSERLKVIGLYIDVARTREVQRLRNDIQRAAEADRRAASLRFSNGDAPRIDVVRADVAVARAQADLAQADADAGNARAALAVEIGTNETALSVPDFASIAVPIASIPSVDDAISAALRARPEIASARADVVSEEAAVRSAWRAVLPGITAQAGWTSGVDTGVPVSGPSANVTLDLPIFHAASERARAEEARLAQAHSRLDAAQQTVTLDVASAVRTTGADRAAVDASARARAEAAQEVIASETGYRNGAISSLELQDARRTYAQASIDDVAARAAYDEATWVLSLVMGAQP